MADNLVKFVYAASATAEQIAAFDSNTIYFVGASGAGTGGKLYKGPRLYDAGSQAAAAELAELKTYIGTLPVDAQYDDLIDYIDTNIAAAQAAGEAAAQAVEDSLADVATSGAAEDVTVEDTAGNFTATDVEGALAELYTAIGTGGTNAAVTVTKTAGGANDDYVYRYVFSQGGTAITNGTIDIMKDMVATEGSLVHPTAQNPITIDGQTITSGAYIEMTIANGDPFYINVADLIEYNTFTDTDEIIVTDSNHSVSMAIGDIAASKITYREADAEQGISRQSVAQAINALESAVGSGGSIDTRIASAVAALDSDGVAATGSVLTGVHIVDGQINSVDEVALTAQNVVYGSGSTVKAALDTIGAIPTTASATTVVDYVDEKTGAGVGALNADLDAALAPTDTDAEAVAVVTGITQSAGVLVSVDSSAADAAGAATRAKAAVIGTAADTAADNTIYGAKAYADAAVTAATAALDADLDASGTATASGVFVMSGITQTDGVLVSVDSVEVEVAGAAAAAEAAAKSYTDSKLTWGTLTATA